MKYFIIYYISHHALHKTSKKKSFIWNPQIFIILTEQVTSDSISVIIRCLSHNQHFMLKKSVELHFLSGGTIINTRDVTACRRLDSSESVNTNILREGSMGKTAIMSSNEAGDEWDAGVIWLLLGVHSAPCYAPSTAPE